MEDSLHIIRERAENLGTRTDWRRPEGPQSFPPATAEQVRAVEDSLDFRLPEFLTKVYCSIGNGGFGPGSGLIGLPGGATDQHQNSILDLYDSFSASNPDDDSWQWPEKLVPICHWSGAIYSCVDCSSRDGSVVCVDLSEHGPGRDLKASMTPQCPTLESWLRSWAEGVDLWQEMFPLDLE